MEKNCDWIHGLGHPRDLRPITRQIGTLITNPDEEFFIRLDL